MALEPTTKDLFTDQPRLEGERPEHRPDDFASSKAAEGSIRFGRALAKGSSDIQVKVAQGAGIIFKGVSLFSTDGSLEDPDEVENPLIIGYRDKDAVGALEKGVVNVLVTEAVNPESPVRIWIAEEDDTSGFQDVEFSVAKAGGDATGLANDATVFTADVTIDGAVNNVTVTGSAAQTFTNLLTQIDADLSGAVSALVGGNIRITSSSTGAVSTISIVDTGGNPLFANLTDFSQFATPVDGSDDPLPNNAGAFTTTAVTNKTTLLEGAKFVSRTEGLGTAILELGGRTQFKTTDDT